ncbi:MAG: histidine phosphatase family protein [Actinomycetota bacterium]
MPTTERTLLLLRHAKAQHGEGMPDHDRELAPRGRDDSRAVGRWLSDPSRALAPDLVICSTSERTRQTLVGLWAGGLSPSEVLFDERVYDAGANGLLDVLLEVPDSVMTVLMIGHAPGIPMLAKALALNGAGSTDALERLSKGFPTSALAILWLEGGWAALSAGTAHLREYVVPRG